MIAFNLQSEHQGNQHGAALGSADDSPNCHIMRSTIYVWRGGRSSSMRNVLARVEFDEVVLARLPSRLHFDLEIKQALAGDVAYARNGRPRGERRRNVVLSWLQRFAIRRGHLQCQVPTTCFVWVHSRPYLATARP